MSHTMSSTPQFKQAVSSSFGNELNKTIAEAHAGWDPLHLIAHLDEQYAINERWGVALAVVCLIAVALRVYVKAAVLKAFRADDYVILGAYVLFIVIAVLNVLYGNAYRKIIRGNMDPVPSLSMMLTAFNSVYAVCTMLCKVSFTLFMLNLFNRSGGEGSRWRRYIILSLLSISSLLGAAFFGLAFTCGINMSEETVHECRVLQISSIASIAWSMSNMLIDVIYAFLCVHLIWSATMNKRNKIWASGLLCFGSIGAGASVLRVITYLGPGWETLNEQRVLINRYSTMEAGITIAAASFATLRPLIRNWFSRIMTSYGNSSVGRAYGKSTGPTRNFTKGGTMKSVVRAEKGEGVFDGNEDFGITKKEEVKVSVNAVEKV